MNALPRSTPRAAALSRAAEDRRIRALRSAKTAVNPWRPIASLVERERLSNGRSAPNLTVFLAGAECPFTCVFCDLWRHTLDTATPIGALPRQLRLAFASNAAELPAEHYSDAWLKLYNASNFFDPRAVPKADLAELAELSRPFARLVVECHPRWVGDSCFAFAERLEGRLQVAMGLETVHPQASSRLGKRSTPEDFAAAARALGERGLGVRAFVLVGAPFIAAAETVHWAVRSVAFACQHGAEHVTLIPLRAGNGELDRLARVGDFHQPRLHHLEMALKESLRLAPAATAVTADLWDLRLLADCPSCFEPRQRRLQQANANASWTELPACSDCEEECL